jgi:hypothetical protein
MIRFVLVFTNSHKFVQKRKADKAKNVVKLHLQTMCLILKKKTTEKYLWCLLLKKIGDEKYVRCLLLKTKYTQKHFSCPLFLSSTMILVI